MKRPNCWNPSKGLSVVMEIGPVMPLTSPSPFWYGTASGIFNYPAGFYQYIQCGQVRIHRKDISGLSRRAVHFADETSLPVDALITATGFSPAPTINFTPSSIHADLGIPSLSYTEEQTTQWHAFERAANQTISAQYPRLLTGPFRSPSSLDPKPHHKERRPATPRHALPPLPGSRAAQPNRPERPINRLCGLFLQHSDHPPHGDQLSVGLCIPVREDGYRHRDGLR